MKAIYTEHGFPPNACKVLKEYNDADTPLKSREAITLLLSDRVISTIMHKFESGVDKIDYDALIDHIFDHAMKKGIFDGSDVSIFDITQMMEIFKREKLYYDFLH